MRDFFLNFPLTVDVAKLFEDMNIIGPMRGVAAQPATEDSPAQDALGDTKRQYICVRADELPTMPKGVANTDPELSIALLGVWADYDFETKKAKVSHLDATGSKLEHNEATKMWSGIKMKAGEKNEV